VAGVELARIDDVRIEQVSSAIFSLEQAEELQIEAVSVRSQRLDPWIRAWLLDRASREVVWQLEDAEVVKRRSRLVHLEDSVSLPAGSYELYLSAFPSHEGWKGDWLEWLRELIGGDDYWDELDDLVADIEVTVSARRGRPGGPNTLQEVRQALAEDALVAWLGVGDDEVHEQAFRLSRDLEVEVYSVGEVTRDGTYDGAWLVDGETGERVWELAYRGSERAGGASKNRRAHTTLSLEAGTYVAHLVTDDSHSWPRFNAQPPFDPMAWGLTIRVVDATARAFAEPVELEDPLSRNVLVELTRMRDSDHRSSGFTIDRPLTVRVYALGEGRGGEMYDYGWMVDAGSRKTVWEMEFRDTEHAGGSDKNRLADRVLELAPGSYMVHYVTDDSHSYRDWNSTPPFDRERWGITVVAVDADFSAGDVRPYDPARDPSVLARIAEVGNHDHERASFTLASDAEVAVYALGEGSDGEMYDYGWIETSSGRAVWEMTYRMTEHAGGARKNRLVRETLLLEAGDYEVHYVTDGSHSYRRWNASPPHDPESWGITVRALGTPEFVEAPAGG
jgi:hypothetical protein